VICRAEQPILFADFALDNRCKRRAQAAQEDFASVPSAITLSNVSEEGTVYTAAETATLACVAHTHGLHVHLDGTRFANAVCSNRHVGGSTEAAELTWRAGVDVMSFGCTKNGAMGADLVIFFNTDLIADFQYRLKRSGHLPSKMRFLSAQILALLLDDVWLRNATNANAMAAHLHEGLEQLSKKCRAYSNRRMEPPELAEANEVFVEMDAHIVADMKGRGHLFQATAVAGKHGMLRVRLVPAWCTDRQECDELLAALHECLQLPLTVPSVPRL
jgi:threonine aldolase